MKKIIIGSRGSDLALWQANFVRLQLETLGHQVEIKVIKTQGDKIQHLSFDKMEGKGFFTKEIEAALLDKSIDLAVHSHKDLETTSPEGIKIAAVSNREDPSELLLIRPDATNLSLPLGLKEEAVVGTSSARRKAQLISYRKDIIINDLRGNVPTRIQKLKDGHYDAILIAIAGVKRLKINLSDLEVNTLDPTFFIPAPAQGVLGLQIRTDDNKLSNVLEKLNNDAVQQQIAIERGVLKALDGGCQLPLGIYYDENNCIHTAFTTDWKKGATFQQFDALINSETIVDRIVQTLNK